MDRMYLWLLAIPIGVYVLRSLWQTHIHPAQVLTRQAANMNWVWAGTVKRDGYRNNRLVRGDQEAVIWYKTGTVTLVDPHCPMNFNDFIELERWLAQRETTQQDGDSEAENKEILYYREIQKFVARHGWFEELLQVEATDMDFFSTGAKVQKTGYLVGESPAVVAALILEALSRYRKNRKLGLEFLAGIENRIRLQNDEPSATEATRPL